MKFITIREFRTKTAEIRKDLAREREIVLTARGRPVAIISSVEPDAVEDELIALRRARARVALDRTRVAAKAKGADRMTMAQVDALIAKVRREKGRPE